MIHYTCDRCQHTIDADEEPRYIVRIDVELIARAPEESSDDGTIDYLADLNEMLEQEMIKADEDSIEALASLNDALCRGDDLDHLEGVFSPPCPSPCSTETKSTLPPSFDMCPNCYAEYMKNPLSRERALKLHFSNN